MTSFAFAPKTGRWEPATTLPTPAPRELHIIMLNVLFDRWRGRPYKPHVVCSERRFEAQWRLFETSSPDILCLHEVTPSYLDGLSRQPWVRERYTMSAVPGQEGPLRPFGNIVLWKGAAPHIRALEAPRLPRAPIAAIVSYEDVGALAVVATHLSAGTGNAARRAAQLSSINQTLQSWDEVAHAVILGDLNLHDASEDAAIPEDLLDAWADVRPGEPGWTFDAARNPMHQEMWPLGFESRRMRLDRILVRRETGLQAQSCGLYADTPLGTRTREPVLGLARAMRRPAHLMRRLVHQTQDVLGARGLWRDPETYLMPSDHFGIEARLGWSR